jgi:PAS domain S-box-containing protein
MNTGKGIDRFRLIALLTLRLELYINLIVVPLAVYFGTVAGRFAGEKLVCIIAASVLAAAMATALGMGIRIFRLSAILRGLEASDCDPVAVKVRILSYPAFESAVIALRWVFGLTCVYVIAQAWIGITLSETLLVILILLLCIPINSVISYCTTEHLLAPALMDERIRAVPLPRDSYRLFSVSARTTLIVISVLVIPLVTLGYFLISSHLEPVRPPNLGIHVLIILVLSIAAVLVTVYESNAGIASGLRMTLDTLEELEKGMRDVPPIPLLTKGEIGVIGQSINVLARSLESSEEMLEKAFRSSPVGIAIWRLEGGIFLDVNESFSDITGYGIDEVAGRAVEEVGLFRLPADYERMAQALARGEKVKNRELELLTKTGGMRTAAMSAEIITIGGAPCIIAAMEDITEKRALEREILIVGERERLKIGQDLHDDLGPHLIGIEVMSELLKKKIEGRSIPTIEDVEKIRAFIEQAIVKTRRLSRGLCPVFLAENGLESLLQEMAYTIAEVHGIDCTFTFDRPIVLGDITACTHIYYIVHEAVHNAVKHGRADRVAIELLGSDGAVTVTIRDNGRGMPSAEGLRAGMGLKIMRFRAHMIGAGLSITSEPGNGTTVRLSLAGA